MGFYAFVLFMGFLSTVAAAMGSSCSKDKGNSTNASFQTFVAVFNVFVMIAAAYLGYKEYSS